jgi:membrane protease YdiL (CAAX protease family)
MTYLDDHDLAAANKAGKQLGTLKADRDAQFALALANADLPKARTMVSFDDEFVTWLGRYSKVVAKGLAAAWMMPLLPFTLVILLGVLGVALLPGVVLVPAHYRGLARRVHGKASLPLFEGIGLRHAWIASAIVLTIPILTTVAMRPDAVGPLFKGGDQSATTQLPVMITGSLLCLLALLPWVKRLGLFAFDRNRVLKMVALVLGCWALIFLLGGLSAVVHRALIGGDSSTLQTRAVHTLVHNGRSEYGLLATWLFVAVLTPVVEEIVFRGMMLGGLTRHISFGWANLVQSLLFATMHSDLPRFLVYLAVGLLAGWLTRRYRSLWPAIVLHALNNTVAMLARG